MILCFIFALFIVPFWVQTSRYDDVRRVRSSRDAALVLGAALWDNQPSPALRERLQMALYLYNKGQVQWIICSGGIGDDGISEAEGMKRYLVDQGVPPKDLLLEENRQYRRKTSDTPKNSSNRTTFKTSISSPMTITCTGLSLWPGKPEFPPNPPPSTSSVLLLPIIRPGNALSIIKYRLDQVRTPSRLSGKGGMFVESIPFLPLLNHLRKTKEPSPGQRPISPLPDLC